MKVGSNNLENLCTSTHEVKASLLSFVLFVLKYIYFFFYFFLHTLLSSLGLVSGVGVLVEVTKESNHSAHGPNPV